MTRPETLSQCGQAGMGPALNPQCWGGGSGWLKGALASSLLSSLLAQISQTKPSGDVPEKVGTFVPGVQPRVTGGGGPAAGCRPSLDGTVSRSGCTPGFCQPPAGGQGLPPALCASASRLIRGHDAQRGYLGSFDAWSQGGQAGHRLFFINRR